MSSPDWGPDALAFREERDRSERTQRPTAPADSPPNNITDFVAAAAAKPKRKRPTRVLPDWASLCISDDYGRVIPNLANVLIALRALPEVKEAFAYDEMSCSARIRTALPFISRCYIVLHATLPGR
jgi:hypothetical protein